MTPPHSCHPQESIAAAVQAITKEMEAEGLKFGALVNNAGMADKYPIEFHPLPDIRKMYEVSRRDDVSLLLPISRHSITLAPESPLFP